MAPRKSKSKSSSDMGDTVLASGGPGSPIDIVFSFDTTGSMNSFISEVKKNVQEIIKRLFKDIPNLRISVFAHGDYCDAGSSYVTKYVDLTNDVDSLCKFVKNVSGTGGGDWEECYELVLKETRQELSWKPGHQRALVMIGDAVPHEASYVLNTGNIDWKKETNLLANNLGMRIYGVQCGQCDNAKPFYEHLAESTGGKHVYLDQIKTVTDLLMAVCYRETGPDFLAAYEKEVRAREGRGFGSELGNMFAALREEEADSCGESSSSSSSAPSPGKARGRTGTKGTPAKPRTTTPARATGLKRKRAVDEDEDDTPGEPVVKRVKLATPARREVPAMRPKARSRHSMVLRRRPRKLLQTHRPAKVVRFHPKTKDDREEVSDKDFKLKTLGWTSWYEAMAPTSAAKTSPSSWARRRHGPGMRNLDLFEAETEVPAVYEFAVTTPESKQKHAVLCKTTKGFQGQNWDGYLLRDGRTERQIDRVLRRGCKLYARRAPIVTPKGCLGTTVNSVDEMRSLVYKNYDYAWSKHYDTESRRYLHRFVEKNDTKISDNPKLS